MDEAGDLDSGHRDWDGEDIRQAPAPLAGPSAPVSDAGRAGCADRPIDSDLLAAAWSVVAAGLRRDIGARTFDHWLKHVKPDGYDVASGELTLCSPSAFTGEWIEKRFADRLRLAWRQQLPMLKSIRITASTRPPAGIAAMPVSPRAVAAAAQPSVPQLGTQPLLDPKFNFENFVQGRSNILALGAAKRVAAIEPPQFHPLYLRAETGQGKTHLLHAIAAATLARSPSTRVTLMSAEKFMLEFVAAMRANEMMAFKARLRAVDVLLIDDLQFIIGKDSTQIELLHTFDDVMTHGGRLVVAADRLPHRLDGIDQRLLSRLAGGLVADIDPPEIELRTAIAERKAAALGAVVPPVVLDWVAQQFPRNIRELEGALNKIVAYAALSDTPIDLATAQARLAETARSSRARITIEEIQRAVCSHYRIDRSEMASQRRTRSVARPRQVAMYLAKQLTPRSFPEIGRRFGGRDHSTVIHACKTIETLRVADADLDTDIRRIQRALTA